MIQNPSMPNTAAWGKSPDFPDYLTRKLIGSPAPSVDTDVVLEDFTSNSG